MMFNCMWIFYQFLEKWQHGISITGHIYKQHDIAL